MQSVRSSNGHSLNGILIHSIAFQTFECIWGIFVVWVMVFEGYGMAVFVVFSGGLIP